MARWIPPRIGGNDDASWSDARLSGDGDPTAKITTEERDRRRRVRRRLTGVLFGSVFLAGSAAALFAEGGYLDRLDADRALRQAQDRLFERAAGVRELRARLVALESGPEPLERIAREQLDYVGPGEITFLLPEDDPFPVDTNGPRP